MPDSLIDLLVVVSHIYEILAVIQFARFLELRETLTVECALFREIYCSVSIVHTFLSLNKQKPFIDTIERIFIGRFNIFRTILLEDGFESLQNYN
jgi:hypothetical protein